MVPGGLPGRPCSPSSTHGATRKPSSRGSTAISALFAGLLAGMRWPPLSILHPNGVLRTSAAAELPGGQVQHAPTADNDSPTASGVV